MKNILIVLMLIFSFAISVSAKESDSNIRWVKVSPDNSKRIVYLDLQTMQEQPDGSIKVWTKFYETEGSKDYDTRIKKFSNYKYEKVLLFVSKDYSKLNLTKLILYSNDDQLLKEYTLTKGWEDTVPDSIGEAISLNVKKYKKHIKSDKSRNQQSGDILRTGLNILDIIH